jgi:diguanylate cyclase (GGDEF)-like protein
MSATPSPAASPQVWRKRLRLAQSGLAVGVLLLIQALLLLEVALGQARFGPVVWFVAVSTLAAWLLYYLVRSGLSERISREPSLSMPQMVDAMACVVWAYALAGPARGALLVLMPLILAFGLFALEVRTGGLAWADPVGHPPRLEAEHWLFTAVAMGAVSVLAGRLGRMRARLRSQKAELSEALMRLQALAMRDSLTGLLNRRAMLDELRAEASLVDRGGAAMSVALVDLDHFKHINDTLGHQVGDRVLQRFAEVARQELRDADRLARWGGEEFLILLPQATPVQAAAILERIRVSLQNVTVEGAPAELSIAFSAGVVRCAGVAQLVSAIECADAAMYQAKTSGRNRTVCLSATPPQA